MDTISKPMTKTLKSRQDFIDVGLTDTTSPDWSAISEKYAIAMTSELAECVQSSDADDPVLRQFLPLPEELNSTPDERLDPIGDWSHSPVEGIVHRHKDRVLLKIVSICPVYCRFCFRREMVGPDKDNMLRPEQVDAAIEYISNHPEIWEVILTGGDPMMLSAKRAAELTKRLEAIPHVKVIRWHTRMPVAKPNLVTKEYARAIKSNTKSVFVALHANHANEFSSAAKQACANLIDTGIAMVSQTVLLKGVNDTPEALQDLMRTFVENRIRPYYLHHPDLAPGTSHFRMSVKEGQKLVQSLRNNLSGLCTPTYVVDIPGGVSKAIATPSDAIEIDGQLAFRGQDGSLHKYPPIEK